MIFLSLTARPHNSFAEIGSCCRLNGLPQDCFEHADINFLQRMETILEDGDGCRYEFFMLM